MLPLGTAAPPFALPEVVSGETISLETFADKKALLVMFLCRHCKYVQHVKQALDAPERLKAMAAEEAFTFPFCYDESQAVAKA